MSTHNQTGRGFPGMRQGGEAAYRFMHCPENKEWQTPQHTPESLVTMRENGYNQQRCRFCGLPLICRVIESVYRYGRFPLTVIEWP